jgi:DNA-binding GntR family transcriptional regulator
VRIPSREDVRGHYVVREALEVQAATLFTKVATSAERTELRRLAARVDAVALQPDRRLYVVLHHKLHRRIAECARCETLRDAIEKTHALASIWFCLMRQPSPDDPQRRHQELMEVLTKGRPHDAGEAMRQHIAVGMQHTMEVLKPYFRQRRTVGETFFRSPKKQEQHAIVATRIN